MKAVKVIALAVVAAASLTVGASYVVGEGANSLKALAMGEFTEVKKASVTSVYKYTDDGLVVEVDTYKKGGENEFFYYKVSNDEVEKFLFTSKQMTVTYHRDLSASICGRFVKELGDGDFGDKKCFKAY